jgi:hypothetical protein
MVSSTTTKLPVATGYRTEEVLYATRYKQGGRTVYSLALTPEQLINLVQRPDPEADNPGNRRIRPAHAQGFAQYFIDHPDWVAPGIILRSPAVFSFEQTETVEGAEFGLLSYPKRAQSDIQILDGQHRILGFHIAFKMLQDEIDKARSQRAQAKRVEGDGGPAVREADAKIADYEARRDRFYTERVMVEIQVTDDIQQYRQLFFDIAENALGITASVKARFDTRKVVNRALPTVLDHPLLKARTDLEVDRVSMSSPYLLSARHIMETIRSLTVGLEGRVSKRQDKELSEAEIAINAKRFFDALVVAAPPLQALLNGQISPEQLRRTSLLGSPLFIRILAGVFHELRTNHAFTTDMIAAYFADLSKHMTAPVHANSIWKLHAPENAIEVGSSAPNGRRQDYRAMHDSIVAWALDREPFVQAQPLDPPIDASLVEDDDSDLTDSQRIAFRELEKVANRAD